MVGAGQQEGCECGDELKHTTGDSMSARAVTAVDPRMVPRIVCGRRNFQQALWNAASLPPAEMCGWAGCDVLAGSCTKVAGDSSIYSPP